MTTAQSPIARQPEQLDYASPTQFRFGIHQLPKVEFNTVSANLPGISVDTSAMATPFKDIPIMGEKATFENLSLSFIVDEYLENYISLHNWMTGISFPQSRLQFSTFRDTTSNTPAASRTETATDVIGQAIPDRSMYSDAFLMILSNKNNPIVEVNFLNIFPISLSALDFTQAATDVDYLTASAEFSYQLYEINTL
jgi:hypothetical protein